MIVAMDTVTSAPSAAPGAGLVDLDRGWSMWPLAALRSAGLPYDRLAPLAAAAELAMPPGAERDAALRARSRAAVDRLLLDDVLLRALAWQNPPAIDNWVGDYVRALAHGESPRLSRMDRRDTLIARYAQRYCAKNDTIGFFGPVSWARWSPGTTSVSGGFGVRRSEVFFEVWAIEAIAAAWAADPVLRRHLPVRPNPSCSVVDGSILRPHRPPVALDAAAAEIAGVLGEVRSVGEVESRFGPAAVAALDRLADEGMVRIGFRVPLDARPERHLRDQVRALPDCAERDVLLSTLDSLDVARRAVASASGAMAVHEQLARLRARVAAGGGHRAVTAPRRTSGGRTPVYLDCRRDLDVELGAELLDGLAAPLGILLDSARWLAGQVGETVEEELGRRYRRLRSGSARVSLADLQFASADVLAQGNDLLDPVVADFQLRWAQILSDGAADGAAGVELDVGEARRRADTLFPASGRLWAAALTHSPDLMLRRAGGGARWVLGELHVALNTLESRVFRTQADDESELVALVANTPPGRVMPVYPNSSPEVGPRTYPPPALDPPGRYRYWSYGADDGHPSGAGSTPATALSVTEAGGRLMATAERDGWAAPVLECYGEFVTALAVNLFRLRPPSRFAPRVALGDLVVCRRSWRFRAGEFGTPARRREDPGHDRMRAFAERARMPRYVFVRTPAAAKPFHVDFAAPLLVDNLARAIRGAAPDAPIDLVEMLPAPDELWLRDGGGARYTSEFRLVAVDRPRDRE
ncbi:lantibiotic dehydratase [Actinomadura sp. B10D3]|uniref:lantibiotic dehydratase n=1 Tax=Actinomadura sp. B10D3 TaxID=3153557 RepID=UPI00325E95EE